MLKQPIAEISHNDCAARRGSRGYKHHMKLDFSLKRLFYDYIWSAWKAAQASIQATLHSLMSASPL